MAGTLARNVFSVCLFSLLLLFASVPQVEAEPDPYLGQCVFLWPQNPFHYIDDYDESINYGTDNEYFNLAWNGQIIYSLTPVTNDPDELGRPYWEAGGYRYTRGALNDYTYGTHNYEICKTAAQVPAPLSRPRSINVPASVVTGPRWVNGTWVEGYTVFWGNSINGATYRLEEATDAGFSTGLRTVVSGTTAQSAAFTSPTAGATYYYRVRAEKNGVISDWVSGSTGCAVSEGDGWSTWWSGPYTENLTRSDFPPQRPLTIRIFYQDGTTWEEYLTASDYYDGYPGTWEISINGNGFDYYEGWPSHFNRIDVRYGTPPQAPVSISVPNESDTGNYTVSWTASATSAVTYHLEEATDSSFSTGLRTVVSGTTSLSAAISSRPGGSTYYYRLRAKKDGLYSAWVSAQNGCTVSPDPFFGQCVFVWPQNPFYYIDDYDESINYGTDNEYFNLAWNGQILYTLTPVVNSPDELGRPYWETGGYRYTRGALNDYTYGTHNYQICKTAAQVPAPLSTPRSINVPASGVTGLRWVNGSWVQGYTVFWGNSIDGATYRLEEATDAGFTTGLRTVVSGTAQSAAISSPTAGVTYYYRVRAEKNGVVSDWVSGSTGCTVSEGDGWSTWWSGPYTENLTRSDFPAERPLRIRIFYQDATTWEEYLPASDYYAGAPGTWEISINGNGFDYYEGYDTHFNRIDVKLAN